MMGRVASLGLAFVVLTASVAAAQTTHVAVIVGLAGDPEHAELFQRWATTLVDASSRLGVSPEHVFWLAEKADADQKRILGRSTREEIARVFDSLAKSAGEEDVVFIVLIGHGSFDGKAAKFNLPGPDMTAAEFEPLLSRLRSRHVVFVNTASASGPFLAQLAGPDRTIITATRTGSERFATLFGGYFVDALAGLEADADKNRRVSVLEAFTYAKREVTVAYEREGIMLTEHAMLSDNGDREGAAAPTSEGKVGRIASVLSLGTAEAADPLPADPKLHALYVERRDIERRVEALKLLKPSMDPARYTSELEKLVTELALKTRQIRELEGAGKLPPGLP